MGNTSFKSDKAGTAFNAFLATRKILFVFLLELQKRLMKFSSPYLQFCDKYSAKESSTDFLDRDLFILKAC